MKASDTASMEELTDTERAELDEYVRRLRKMPTDDIATEWSYHDEGLRQLGEQITEETADDEVGAFLGYLVADHLRKRDACEEELDRRRKAGTLPAGNAVGVDPAVIREIKEHVDLRDLIEGYGVQLHQRGREFVGRCPFHQDEKPSLHVNPSKGLWHCFGCDAGGDGITFLMRHESLEFMPALHELAAQAGIELSRQNRKEPSTKSDQGSPQNDPELDTPGGQYLIRDGRICRRKQTQHGEVIIPLSNFVARIIEEVAHDDGVQVKRFLSIAGQHVDGSHLPAASVEASQFSNMRWVTPNWGTHAIVEAGQSTQDHLRAAIQHQSPDAKSRYVYTHTGWREIDGKMVFLTQEGAIGAEGVVVQLEKEMERYRLPTEPQDLRDAMQTSLRFLGTAPRRVTVPLWAAMYVAPLAPLVPLKFLLWLVGRSGALKTSLAAVALSHFGDFTGNELPNWLYTANSLEKYLFLAKDVPFLIDDFAPQSDRNEALKMEATAARIVRSVGNRSGRGRLRSDLTLNEIYSPRGLVLATGEQLPDGQSILARLVTIDLAKGDVDIERLSQAQNEHTRYPHAMAGYIRWLASHWDHLNQTISASWLDLRSRAYREGQHLRLPEALASLYVGLDLGLGYAVDLGALTESEAKQLGDEGWAALVETAERQHTDIEAERPTLHFLTVLGELIAQGKVRLADLGTTAPSGDGDLIGWQDAEYFYLLPSVAYHRVAQFAREAGRHFGIKEMALRKALAEEGFLLSTEGRYTDLIRCGSERHWVLRLWRKEVEKILGGPCG